MKPKKLKPGKCWGLAFGGVGNAASIIICNEGLTFRLRREAVVYAKYYARDYRPRVVRLEVREI